MRWILLAMSFLIFVACARFNSVGWIDLPNGHRLKAMTLQVESAIGTDITYGLIYDCEPSEEDVGFKERVAKRLLGTAKPECVKVGEFGGASPAMLKSVFGNAAAGAAIGTGLALQDFEGDRVNVEGSKQQQGQLQLQKQNQKVITPRPRKRH